MAADNAAFRRSGRDTEIHAVDQIKIRILLNRYRCSSKNVLIKQRTQKKKILQRYADSLYLIPSNPCNAISKCSSIGTRILISLTWRTRCIRNAPCRCIAYAVSSFSAVTSGQYTFSAAAPPFNKHSYKSEETGASSTIYPFLSVWMGT